MSRDINELLFEYIREAIYGKQMGQLDIEALPEDYQKLGAGIQQFCFWVQETKHFSEELAKGNLDVEPPNVENVIAANIKAVQGTLRHLTWQAEQIAKGDYNQRVEFMGMFSTAFNRMTDQLRDRTEALAREMHYVSEQNESMRRNNEMFQIFTQKSQDYIVILSAEDGTVLYSNDIMKELLQEEQELLLGRDGMLSHCPCNSLHTSTQWEYKTSEGRYYSIQSIYIQWDGQDAIAHSFMDITEKKEREAMIKTLVFKDSLTGNYNRRYGMELLEQMGQKGDLFSLGFIDIDFLKYCNDEIGHERGDQYIQNVSKVLMEIPGDKTVCRVGGDEFMVIMEKVTVQQAEDYLNQAREQVMRSTIEKGGSLPQCFSFGVVDNAGEEDWSASDMLGRADRKMYRFKIAEKEKMKKRFRDELQTFVDDRLD